MKYLKVAGLREIGYLKRNGVASEEVSRKLLPLKKGKRETTAQSTRLLLVGLVKIEISAFLQGNNLRISFM